MFNHKKPGMNVDHSSSSKLAGLLDKIDQSRESSGSNDAAKEAFVAPIAAGEIQYGWVEYFDPASQLPYYYNVILKTTQWAKPNVLEVSIEKSQNASQQEYTEKAYFSKESGKFSGTSSYWQKMGRAEDKAGRQLGVFMDLSTLEENREQAKLMKEEARKKSGSRGDVDWSVYKEEKKATKKRKASAWVYDP